MTSKEVVFERTPSGKIGKFNFYTLPLVWVEGPDDVTFFAKLLRQPCRLEAANGRDACELLAEELKVSDLPYAVIMDSDYDVLDGISHDHPRVVFLDRYAMENYFFDRGTLERVCQSYIGNQEAIERFGDYYESKILGVLNALKELIALDVVHARASTGHKSFPDGCDEFCDHKCEPKEDRVSVFKMKSESALGRFDASQIIATVHAFSERRGLVCLVRGHFAFSLVRRFVVWVLTERGSKPTIDNKGLLILMSSELARSEPEDQHGIRQIWENLITQTKQVRDSYKPVGEMTRTLF